MIVPRNWLGIATLTLALVGLVGAFGVPVGAQNTPKGELRSRQEAGRTANVGGGRVGERQAQQANSPNIDPLRRIESRIQNRVQNRIRNRIDRYYDPQANTRSPFEVAREQASNARKPKSR
jgi:hypothetical protein